MLRTLALSTCLALGGYASAAWLTHDFQVWTAEGARRLEVALSPVATPVVATEGPGLALQPLAGWLADGHTVTLVDFVYTRCQTVCLALGSTFQQMQASLQTGRQSSPPDGSTRVRLLSISFDGTHDTPAVLQRYAGRLNADPGLWQFARVPDAAQSTALLKAFDVVVVPDGRGDFEHNAALLVIDPGGRLVRIFDYAEHTLALDYARDLASRAQP